MLQAVSFIGREGGTGSECAKVIGLCCQGCRAAAAVVASLWLSKWCLGKGLKVQELSVGEGAKASRGWE